MASIKSKLKITLYGKTGKEVKTLKAAKSFTLYYGKKLVAQRNLRQPTDKKKELFISKLYTDTHDFLYLQDIVIKQDKHEAQKQFKREKQELIKKLSKKDKKLYQAYITSSRKQISSKKLGRICYIKKQFLTLKNEIAMNIRNKSQAVYLAKNVFSPYIRKFVHENFEKSENFFQLRIRLTHRLSKRDFTIKKTIKTNSLKRGVSLARERISNIPDTINHLEKTFAALDEKVTQYLERKFTTNIYITGFDLEVIEEFIDGEVET